LATPLKSPQAGEEREKEVMEASPQKKLRLSVKRGIGTLIFSPSFLAIAFAQ